MGLACTPNLAEASVNVHGLWVPTAGVGTYIYGVVVVGTGSFAAGAMGGVGGGALGEVVYEVNQ